MNRQGETLRYKTRQDRTRQDQAKRDYTGQHQKTHCMTTLERYEKTRQQDQTRQDNPRQDTRQEQTRHDKTPDKNKPDKNGPCQCKTRHGWCMACTTRCKDTADRDEARQGKTIQNNKNYAKPTKPPECTLAGDRCRECNRKTIFRTCYVNHLLASADESVSKASTTSQSRLQPSMVPCTTAVEGCNSKREFQGHVCGTMA